MLNLNLKNYVSQRCRVIQLKKDMPAQHLIAALTMH